eukprot:TRINITY_DN14623_c0_g1_i1.p1 TRINITY_DN14623_c0_g1~~TRINITY_DN14623_c0_g1_i1.p1  ORF type:complete len:450 (+),score=73.02 TRINITY_DN14623_c0_g1_i1:39-1388(+)
MSDLRKRKHGSDDGSDEGVLVDKPAEVEVFPQQSPTESAVEPTEDEDEPLPTDPPPTAEEPEEPPVPQEEVSAEPSEAPTPADPEPTKPEPEAPEPLELKQESDLKSRTRSKTAPAVREPEPMSPATPYTPIEGEDGELADTLSKVMMKKVVDRYPMMEDVFQKLIPVGEKISEGIDTVGPHVMKAWEKARIVFQNCPWEIILSFVGLVLCFFGGAFVTLIAAVEAFRLCGGSRTMRHLRELYRDYVRVRLAARRNQLRNPTAKLKPHDYLVVAFKSVKDPQRLSSSMSGVYTALLAVFATLRVQFARTITLGSSIGDFIKVPVIKYTKPSLEHVIRDPDYVKWIPTITEWLCRMVGVSIAWYAQRMNAALQSSLRGGHMCIKHAGTYLRNMKYLPSTPHDDMLEAGAGYALALLGLYCQLWWGFSVPFPLSIIVLPLSILESCLLFFM